MNRAVLVGVIFLATFLATGLVLRLRMSSAPKGGGTAGNNQEVAQEVVNAETGSEIDWALCYKTENDRLQKFWEVRRVNSSVVVTSGNIKTWGSSTSTDYASREEAQSQFRVMLQKQVADGFVLTRQGAYNPRQFNFKQLASEIRDGARKAFTAIRKAHPNETVNSFALVSDNSAMTICHCANSKEALQKKGRIDEDCQWNSAEWSYCEGDEHLDIAYRLILTRIRDDRVIDFWEFKQGVIEASVSALEMLDREGFFGTDKQREECVILFQIKDEEYDLTAIKRLNTPAVFARFHKWWKSWN